MSVNTEKNGIYASIGLTKNLGNYESLKLEASVFISDADPNDKEAWDNAWNIVDEQLEAKLKEADQV